MALFYQQNINEYTKLGIWKIEEAEDFFRQEVPLMRTIAHPHKRLQHLAGRYLLRQLYPDFPYKEIMIADTKKPFLPDERYHFSISHCSNYAAAIVSTEERVGIDIELTTERVFKILHKFLHPEELEQFQLGNIDNLTDARLSTLLWSSKEAMFKWWGWGDIDFSEVLRIKQFQLQEEGKFSAYFSKNDVQIPLRLHYKTFDKLCMVYTLSEPDVFKITD
jgi:phosphopantetheinyl transferase